MLIKRQGILSLIQDIEYVKLCALIAPAGYGKSTSASLFTLSYSSIYAFRWIGLHHFDEDFYTFISKFSKTLTSIYPEFQDTFWIQYESLKLSPKSSEKNIQRFGFLIGEILDEVLTEELILVLDDYQHVNSSSSIKSFMTGFIDGSPSHLKLIFTSRTALNLNIMKYMVSQNYLEISKEDLRFSESEVEELVQLHSPDKTHVTHNSTFIDELHKLTGGWAGSLVLAMSQLGKTKHEKEILLNLYHTKDTINKYLSEQVFNELPGEMQLFMLSASVIPEFSSHLSKNLYRQIIEFENEFSFLSPCSSPKRSTSEIIEKLLNAQLISGQKDKDAEFYMHQLLRDFLLSKIPHPVRLALYRACGKYYETKEPILSLEFYVLAEDAGKSIALLWKMLQKTPNVSLVRLKEKLTDIKRLGIDIKPFSKLTFLSAKLEHLLGNISNSEHLLNELQSTYKIAKESLIDFQIQLLSIENDYQKADFSAIKEKASALISALKKSHRTRLNSILAKSLTHYAYALSQTSSEYEELKTSIKLINEAWELSRDLDDNELVEQILRVNYFVAIEIGLDEVTLKFNDRYERLSQTNPKNKIDLLKDYAFMLTSFGNFKEALPKIQQSLLLAENYAYESAIATLNFLMAECESAKGDFHQAHIHYNKAIDYFLNVTPSHALVILYTQVLNAFYSNHVSDIPTIVERAHDVFATINQPTLHNQLHYKLCVFFVAISQQKYAKAESIITDLIKQFEPPGIYTVTILSELNLFKSYIFLKSQNGLDEFKKTICRFFELINNLPKDQAQTALKRHWRLAEQILTNAQTQSKKNEVDTFDLKTHDIENALNIIIVQKRSLGLFDQISPREMSDEIKCYDAQNALHIQTFGQLNISVVNVNGNNARPQKSITEQDFPNTASLQAFKILLLHHHQPVLPDTLIEYIWPKSYSRHHHKMLQNAVSGIRKTFYKYQLLEPNQSFLTKHDEGYKLNLGKHGVNYVHDMEEFKTLLNQARLSEQKGLNKTAAEKYENAIALYRGDLLYNDRYEVWAAYYQETLKDQYVQALLFLAEYYYEAQITSKAEALCQKILAVDPISETAYELLIKSCKRRNLFSKAQKIFKSCKKAFRKELNTFPPLHIERLIKEFDS